jgi:hypothetical protein
MGTTDSGAFRRLAITGNGSTVAISAANSNPSNGSFIEVSGTNAGVVEIAGATNGHVYVRAGNSPVFRARTTGLEVYGGTNREIHGEDAVDSNAADLNIRAGNTGRFSGGTLNLTAGTGGFLFPGSDVANGGVVNISGTAGNQANGGAVNITGGGVTNGNFDGGDITLNPGAGNGTGRQGQVIVNSDTVINGNLNVIGTKTQISSVNVDVEDNHLYLNAGYTAITAQTGGLAVNYSPIVNEAQAIASFTAGVAAASDPVITLAGAVASVVAGNFIQVSGAADLSNNGIYEVQAVAGNDITLRGVGLNATVEDFTQNQVTTDGTAGGTVTHVNLSVLRAGTDGAWEAASGSSAGLTFIDVTLDGSVTLQDAYDNSTSGAREIVLTDGATEGVVIRDNSLDNADPIFQVEDNLGVTTHFAVLGDGTVTSPGAGADSQVWGPNNVTNTADDVLIVGANNQSTLNVTGITVLGTDINVGNSAFAVLIGDSTVSGGGSSVTIGQGANGGGPSNTTIGQGARGSQETVSVGLSANASGISAVAVGANTNAVANGTALGRSAVVSGAQGVALGVQAQASAGVFSLRGPTTCYFGSQGETVASAVENVIWKISARNQAVNLDAGNLTIQSGQGRGTGSGGDLILQVAPSGIAGDVLNPFITALSIDGNDGTVSITPDGDNGLNFRSGTVDTTDATETTAATYTTTADSIAMLTAKITCRRTGGTGVGTNGDGNVYERKVRVKNVGGTVTLGTIATIYTDEDAAINAASVTLDVSGTDVRVRVTGITDVNFTWDVVLEDTVNS